MLESQGSPAEVRPQPPGGSSTRVLGSVTRQAVTSGRIRGYRNTRMPPKVLWGQSNVTLCCVWTYGGVDIWGAPPQVAPDRFF